MKQPAYIILSDHDDIKWEIDIGNEESIELLMSAQAHVKEKIACINWQLDANKDCNYEWEKKAKFALALNISQSKAITKRLKFLQRQNNNKLSFINTWLAKNHPEIYSNALNSFKQKAPN